VSVASGWARVVGETTERVRPGRWGRAGWQASSASAA
jgi:hypothetical protein